MLSGGCVKSNIHANATLQHRSAEGMKEAGSVKICGRSIFSRLKIEFWHHKKMRCR